MIDKGIFLLAKATSAMSFFRWGVASKAAAGGLAAGSLAGGSGGHPDFLELRIEPVKCRPGGPHGVSLGFWLSQASNFILMSPRGCQRVTRACFFLGPEMSTPKSWFWDTTGTPWEAGSTKMGAIWWPSLGSLSGRSFHQKCVTMVKFTAPRGGFGSSK